jgi:hypothetical protein
METIEDPEIFLKKVCKLEDWSSLEDNLNDFISTNNVIKYMREYAEYVLNNVKHKKKIITNRQCNKLKHKYRNLQCGCKVCERCNSSIACSNCLTLIGSFYQIKKEDWQG